MTPVDAPNDRQGPSGEIPKTWLRKIRFLMNFGAPKGHPKDPKQIILGAKRRRKTHQEIVRKSVSEKLQL